MPVKTADHNVDISELLEQLHCNLLTGALRWRKRLYFDFPTE